MDLSGQADPVVQINVENTDDGQFSLSNTHTHTLTLTLSYKLFGLPDHYMDVGC